MDQYGDRYPAQLSGGERQRVGLARALAADPPVVLMDEPFGALDPITRRHLQNQFLELQSALHKTAVLVTHDVDEALRLADQIAILADGEVVQIGPPSAIRAAPATDFVAEFVRDAKVSPSQGDFRG
jgi:osmoprotectant transport system ATP-binding protein